eukprot:CAMPEP_0171343606 /NCGR_PEP_ID=MMETSP0878-20121228/17549_1 /TAXON_ID=67004 /ORGANISM="Thalassiosira weissflogii, Strain CCMP1336" /LENGTH=33 /DNA_ID= /DNA_START= /DNA_END= /DNA_ORIENTATION=
MEDAIDDVNNKDVESVSLEADGAVAIVVVVDSS